MEPILDGLNRVYVGVALWRFVAAALAILAGFSVRPIVLLFVRRVRRLTERTQTRIDDVLLDSLERPIAAAAVFGGVAAAVWLVGSPLADVPPKVTGLLAGLIRSVFVVLGLWFAFRLVEGLCRLWAEATGGTESRLDDQLVPIVRNASKTFIVLLGLLLVLQNLGYSVSALLAGLGLGGMAIALASKDTIANLFGSLVIFIDRPFHVGDWIEVGGTEGTVEEVGMRTTRIRTFANSQITVPNAIFTTSNVNNWSRMKKRRVKMTVGLTYDSSPDQMAAAVAAIREIIGTHPQYLHDFYLVNFTDFGPSSLDVFIYCFTTTTNWAEYLEARQDLLLKIMHAVSELGLEFAFPTQTVHVASGDVPGLDNLPPHLTRELPE